MKHIDFAAEFISVTDKQIIFSKCHIYTTFRQVNKVITAGC